MSLAIKFHFTSSVLNMFRTLIHPSSGACDFSIVSPHWLCVIVSMCWSFGVVGLGWYLCGRLKPSTQLYLCVLCGSQNKQRLFPYTTLTDWFL